MADVSEDDSDVEMSSESTAKVNKKKYTHQTRDLSTKSKKSKLGDEDVDESEIIDEKILNEEEDDEEYFKRFLNKEIEYKEDDLEMQLRFEREEQERKAAAKKEEESKKTKTDPDGTVYEWDENVKGWFPKVNLILILAAMGIKLFLRFITADLSILKRERDRTVKVFLYSFQRS